MYFIRQAIALTSFILTIFFTLTFFDAMMKLCTPETEPLVFRALLSILMTYIMFAVTASICRR